MVSQVRLASLLTFFFVIFCLSHSAFAAKASRIELKDGTVYENVTFTVDTQYQVITVKMGDWKKNVGFLDIARIIDEEGDDVTAKVLGDYYKPVEEERKGEWLSEEDTTYKIYQKRPFDFGMRAGANYSFPIGDYYDGTESGVGYGIDVMITVTRNVAVRGTISRAGMRDDLKSMFPGIMIVEDNLCLNVWRYAVSGQYYKWPRWRTGGKLLYYGFAGLGVITHKFSGSATVQDPVTGELVVLYGTGDTENKFMLTYGGGIISMISDRVGIEMEATFDVVFVGTAEDRTIGYYGEGQTASIFGLKAGIVGLF